MVEANQLKTLIIILAFFIHMTGCIIIKLDPSKSHRSYNSPLCFHKHFLKGEIIQITFAITGGQQVDKVNALLFDNSNNLVFEKLDAKNGALNNYNVENGGEFKLCFKPLSKGKININFNFNSSEEELLANSNKSLATDSSLRDMVKSTQKINVMMDKMMQNSNFLVNRRSEHTEIINSLISSLRTMAFIKFFVVVAISLVQIYFIRTFYIRRENKWNI